jgi:glycosyltransferase involved in cell wall biosynthesis
VQKIFLRRPFSPKFTPKPAGLSMKLLVFAHTPPPHHGQSYMVKLMLDGFGGDCRRQKNKSADAFGIECYHVNARFSRALEDVGEFQGGKIFLILFYCLQALWCRFRHGVTTFYYVPAPGKTVAVYRDWLVMLLCRPFFKKIILHWHAAGLAKWLETCVQIRSRAITYRLFKPVEVSIVLSRYNFADAEKMLSHQVRVVNNGIPDPCPDFEKSVLPYRRERFATRARIYAGESGGEPVTVHILFLAHCTREKGLFAAAEAVLCVNRQLATRGLPMKLKLSIAGNFVTEAERAGFIRFCQNPECDGVVEHLGFVSGSQKEKLLRASDLLLFPTRYLGENQPVNLIEAMAFGLPVVTTRWRSLPELLPPDYSGLVDDQDPEKLAAAILKILAEENSGRMRGNFTTRFTLERHLADLAAALHDGEVPG